MRDIEFVPVLCGSGNSQIDLLRRQNQVGVISVQIRDRIVFVPALVFPFLDSPGSHRSKIFIFHGWLHAGPTIGHIEESVLLICHEREEIVGRLFLFG